MTGQAEATDSFEDPVRAVEVPVLSAGDFAAPIDRLLEMARGRRIDLARLAIGALIGSFAEALEAALERPDRLDVARWGDWLVMAATLTQLWSRLLPSMPASENQSATDPAELFRDRLLARAVVRDAADWLENRLQVGRDVFRRGGARGGPRRGGRPTSPICSAPVWCSCG